VEFDSISVLTCIKKMISEILKAASAAQYLLKGLAEIQLFIFKHLPIKIDPSFRWFLLCIPSVSKIIQHIVWPERSLSKLPRVASRQLV